MGLCRSRAGKLGRDSRTYLLRTLLNKNRTRLSKTAVSPWQDRIRCTSLSSLHLAAIGHGDNLAQSLYLSQHPNHLDSIFPSLEYQLAEWDCSGCGQVLASARTALGSANWWHACGRVSNRESEVWELATNGFEIGRSDNKDQP